MKENIYYVGEQKYKIPENLTEQFLANEPEAQKGLNYLVGDSSFNDIPPLLQDTFMKQNPNAILQDDTVVNDTFKSTIAYEDKGLESINKNIESNLNLNLPKYETRKPLAQLSPKPIQKELPNYWERLVALPSARRYSGGGFKKTAGSYLQTIGATSPRGEKEELISPRQGYGGYKPEISVAEAIQKTKENVFFQQGVKLYQDGVKDYTNRPDLQPTENYMDYSWLDPRKIASIVGEAIPTLLEIVVPATIATLVTKNPTVGVAVASSAAFGIETGGMMQTAIEEGIEPSEAANVALTVGMINGLISALPASTLLSKMGLGKKAMNDVFVKEIIKRGLYKNIKKNALEQGLAEMAEEVLQETVNIYAETQSLGIELTDKGITDRLLASGIGGGVLGSTLGAGKGAVQSSSAKQSTEIDNAETTKDAKEQPKTEVPPETEAVKPPQVDETKIEADQVSSEIEGEPEVKDKTNLIDQEYEVRSKEVLTEEELVGVYTSDIVNKKGETLKWAQAEPKTPKQAISLLKKLEKYVDERQDSENDLILDNVYEAQQAIDGIIDVFENRGLNIADDGSYEVFNVKEVKSDLESDTEVEPVEASETAETTETTETEVEPIDFSKQIEKKYNVTLDLLGTLEKNDISLSRIVVPEGKRGEGVGTKVIADIIEYADRNNKRIVLTPTKEFGATSVKRLKDLYKKFGFVENKGKNKDFTTKELMYRVPKNIKTEVETTETQAIQEVVDLFQGQDTGVEYTTKLDELRTLQDNIEDPDSPETLQNAYAQLNNAGRDLEGLEPSDVVIAGENYTENRDTTLVDVVKLYKGADIGTVIEERAEVWYKKQEESNKNFDSLITKERKKYYEQTKESDDASQSNLEWFSNRAKDNAISGRPKGKFGNALTQLLKRFREYAKSLIKSSERFVKNVKEGKVSKKLKSLLDRSITEKIKSPKEIHSELMADVDGRPSPTKITYSLKQTKEIVMPSKVKNQGVTFITGDPVNINLKGDYEDFGIRYPRTYRGWALDNPANATKLLNDTEKGYNVLAITSLVDVKGSMVKNKSYLNALYRALEDKVGKVKAKSLLKKHEDVIKAAKEGKVNAVEIAKQTAVPDFSQISRKVVAVAKIKDFRTGDSRNRKHPEYKIEVNFPDDISGYRELPQPIDLDTFVKALPQEDSRAKMPFYAAKQYWLTILNQESPQVKMLSDFADTGDASIFDAEPESYQFASPQIKEIGLDEAIKNIKSKELIQYHRSIAEVEVELGIKSMTTVAIGEGNTGAEATVMTTITEEVAYDKREYLAAIKGLLGTQEAILDFQINEEGLDNLYTINLNADLKTLPKIFKSLTERGIEHKTLPIKGNKIDLVIVDEGGSLVNYVNKIRKEYNAKTRLQRGNARFIGNFGNRAKADEIYIGIIRKYEGDTGRYSKVLRDRLPIHRPRFNRSVLPKKTKPTYQLKKITPDERKLREDAKIRLAEITNEGSKMEAKKVPQSIIKRRIFLGKRAYKTNQFLNKVRTITTPTQRELIPFLLEGSTSIPKKLKRPDLESMIQDKKLVESLQPVVKSFRERYNILWKEIAEGNQKLSNKEIKDYVTHIWDIPSSKTSDVASWFSTSNKFTNKRYIETLVEGIEDYDLKPKFTDITDIFNIYSSITNNSLANKEFVKDVRAINVKGKPLIANASNAPDGWVEIHHPAMRNPFTKQYYKIHPDLKAPLKVVLSNRIELDGTAGKVLSSYETINGLLKQTQLAVSLFHHLALSETAMPLANYRDVPKMLGVLLKTPWKGFLKMESEVWQKEDSAIDFIEHLGQLGVSADIPVQKITSQLKGLEVKFKGTPIAGKATKLAFGFYERWNFALWDYLHDHFKLYAYESLVSNYKGKDIETYKFEMASLVNDTFGGQNWDVLMVNPQTVQMMTNFLLSPDWLVSTMRQALAPTGIGSAMKTKEGRAIRRKAGARFWLKAFLYYGVLINSLNILNRKKDMEDNEEFYPDKEDFGFWDYTMFGNSIGSQTRLFMGRYSDGTERYIRWGKQFRELPELFYDETGFNVPQAAGKKLVGKAAPALQIIPQLFNGGVTLSGFQNYDLKDKKGQEYVFGVLKTLMKAPLPFSTSTMLDKTKDFNASDFVVPSSKGMTSRSAGKLMETALIINDLEMIRQVVIACTFNQINSVKVFDNTKSRMIIEYRAEETRLLKEIKDLEEAINNPKTKPQDKGYYMKKIAEKKADILLSKDSKLMLEIILPKIMEAQILYPDVFGELKTEK